MLLPHRLPFCSLVKQGTPLPSTKPKLSKCPASSYFISPAFFVTHTHTHTHSLSLSLSRPLSRPLSLVAVVDVGWQQQCEYEHPTSTESSDVGRTTTWVRPWETRGKPARRHGVGHEAVNACGEYACEREKGGFAECTENTKEGRRRRRRRRREATAKAQETHTQTHTRTRVHTHAPAIGFVILSGRIFPSRRNTGISSSGTSYLIFWP